MSSPVWEELASLCRLPHRGSTTEGERRAADWIAGRLERLGYDVSRQSFRAPRATLYAGPSVALGIVAAAAGAGLLSRGLPPSLTLLVAVSAALPLVGELLGWRRVNFDLLLPKRPSQNVIGREKGDASPAPQPDGGATDADDYIAKQVIVAAHYDTQLGSPLFAPQAIGGLKAFFVVAYASLAALLALMAAETVAAWTMHPADWADALRAPGPLVTLRVAFAALAALCAAWLLVCRALGRPVNGANDNGSGVALALALARRLKEDGPIPGARLTFAFTGSEEVGERGMRRFLDSLPIPPRRSTAAPRPTVINLDNLGAGKLRYLTGEGMLRYFPYDPELVAAARAVSARHPEGTLSAWRNLPLPTDGLVSVTRGVPTITFVAIDDDGRIPNYHWHTDKLERVDPELLDRAADVLWEYVRAVSGAAAPAPDSSATATSAPKSSETAAPTPNGHSAGTPLEAEGDSSGAAI